MEISDKYVWKWQHKQRDEERYYLWFDPSKEFHRYSILWTPKIIIFYIDDVPIREIVRNEEMGADFPSKPMSLYATIWDASDWATSGGKYKANYKYAPFVAEFIDLVLHGCTTNPLEEVVATDCAGKDDQLASADFASMTSEQRMSMKKFRQRYIYYSYCYDRLRYPVPPPECIIDPIERQQYKITGRLKFDEKHHHQKFKKRGQITGVRSYGNQEDI
ncbi:probable xyloglucan endotransglucosylase/hydrolase protein 30 [Phtheirospermum japonicum]|uniref:Xyloglucan endotransglucosylase/hydrolase n=1 Tax=Phtheirospermum japonicum TaxID=374723 RepID=A0A830D5W7_9LAMI|nr:probable xyloglucan endotransglucosylase/hydrolase protein 30 [Phtheirospermum japonicum]